MSCQCLVNFFLVFTQPMPESFQTQGLVIMHFANNVYHIMPQIREFIKVKEVFIITRSTFVQIQNKRTHPSVSLFPDRVFSVE